MSVYFLTTFFESSLSNELAQRNRKGNNKGISDENANDLVINLLKKENQSENANDRTGWVKISPYLDSLESLSDICVEKDKSQIHTTHMSRKEIVKREKRNRSEEDSIETKLCVLDASCKRLKTLLVDKAVILQTEEKETAQVPQIVEEEYVCIDYSVNRIQNKYILKERMINEASHEVKDGPSFMRGSHMDSLSFLPYLYILDLSYNLLESFEYFCPLPTLQVLLLKSNQINSIKNLDRLFPSLRYLDLSYNNLETLVIPESTDDDLTSSVGQQKLDQFGKLRRHNCLKVIKLNGNVIKHSSSNGHSLSTFIKFISNIRDFDLSDNLIENIDFLSSLKNLEFVNITKNRIEDLDEMCTILQKIKTLKVIHCKENPFFTCFSQTTSTPEEKIVDEQKFAHEEHLKQHQRVNIVSSNLQFYLADKLSMLPHLERINHLEISEPILDFLAEAQYKKDMNGLIEQITAVYNLRLEKEKENNDQVQQKLKKNGKDYMDHYLDTRRKLEKELDSCVRYVQYIDLKNKSTMTNIQNQIQADFEQVKKLKLKDASMLNSLEENIPSVSQGTFENSLGLSHEDKFKLPRILQDYTQNLSSTGQDSTFSPAAREYRDIKTDFEENATNDPGVDSNKLEKSTTKTKLSNVARKLKNFLFV